MRLKIINTEKYEKNETEHEEPSVTDNPVAKEPSYFNIFRCGKNFFNDLDATCKRACMANSRDKYYTELLRTTTDFNNRNDELLSNDNIQEAIHKFILKEESDAHNITFGCP